MSDSEEENCKTESDSEDNCKKESDPEDESHKTKSDSEDEEKIEKRLEDQPDAEMEKCKLESDSNRSDILMICQASVKHPASPTRNIYTIYPSSCPKERKKGTERSG